MENASKALIMAAGVLIGVLILSLAAFLFLDFGATSESVYSQMESQQLTQYNAQYTVYSGRNDITIYEIISLANLAKENNNYYKYYTDYEDVYKVQVFFPKYQNLQDESSNEKQNLINLYNAVDNNGNLITKFKCKTIEYHDSGGRVRLVKFEI